MYAGPDWLLPGGTPMCNPWGFSVIVVGADALFPVSGLVELPLI